MHGSMPIADSHNDLLIGVQYLHERGHHDPFGDFWLPQLRQGGVALQVLSICTEEQYTGESALRRGLLLVEQAHRIAALHPQDVALVTDRDALQEALQTGRIALVLALEGAEPVGADLAILDTFFRLGVRMASLTWNRRTMLADGVGEERTGGRVTTLGVAAVAEMERLGMVLDVSHLADAGFWHIMEVATRAVVASHSSARAVYDHPRNLSDEQLRAIASSGGFVAVNGFGGFLADAPVLPHLVDHIAHVGALIGFERVGLGLDFIADLARVTDPILGGGVLDLARLPVIADLQRPADLGRLSEALVDRLGSDTASRVAHRTVTDFMLDHLPMG